LHEIGNARHVAIETFQNVVRLTASKQQALYAADDIVKKIEEATVQKFLLEDVRKRILGSNTTRSNAQKKSSSTLLRRFEIQQIAKATGTYISSPATEESNATATTATESLQSEVSSNLIIYGKDIASVQDAIRNLLAVFDFQPRRARRYVDVMHGEDNILCRLATESNLPLSRRNQLWARWVAKTPKSDRLIDESFDDTEHSGVQESSPEEGETTPDTSDERMANTLDIDPIEKALFERPLVQERFSMPPLEAGVVSMEHSALFGQVLHRCVEDSTGALTIGQKRSRRQHQICFSASFPNVMDFATWLSTQQSSMETPDSKAGLTYRFVPSLGSSNSKPPTFDLPVFEVDVLIDPSGEDTAPRVNFILGEAVTDVSVPTRASDIRFQNRILFQPSDLASLGLDKVIAEIQGMMGRAGPLRGPADVDILVPTWASTTNKPKENQEAIPAQYQLAGIQFQQSVDVEHDQHGLTYMDIEGGVVGGKRTEISLHSSTVMNAGPSTSIEADLREKYTQLIRATCRLTDHIQEVSLHGPPADSIFQVADPTQGQANLASVSDDAPLPLEEAPEAAEQAEDHEALSARAESEVEGGVEGLPSANHGTDAIEHGPDEGPLVTGDHSTVTTGTASDSHRSDDTTGIERS
jgi:hypothetical protein